MRKRIHALTSSELVEAEELERLGKRRANLLRLFRAERFLRDGRKQKMLRLRVEVQ